MKRVGILGGTFDPPHLGHLIIAEEVKLALDLDEVWFIPTNEPPHKKKANTHVHERINMLEIATQSNSAFHINAMETERLGKSYTFDTMNMLTDKHPTTSFYFIIGGDMVEYLPKWHRIEELTELVTFVGVARTGYSLASSYPITRVEVPLIDISSTMIRQRLENHKTVHYLIPSEVYTHIKERRLYEDK
ncbi:MAG TPA: nicotinate-nucleotide adenylyltransferase [Virgibacillus sp.]|nr:nicotinate-nucleotide adenylyltransferase [Virgibacillus sp.]